MVKQKVVFAHDQLYIEQLETVIDGLVLFWQVHWTYRRQSSQESLRVVPVESGVASQVTHCLQQHENVYREMDKIIYFPKQREYFALTKTYCSF